MWGTPIPRRVPLFMVTGKPIPVPHLSKDHPDFESTVDEVHQAFMAALQDLYDRHRGEYGWAHRPLVIE